MTALSEVPTAAPGPSPRERIRVFGRHHRSTTIIACMALIGLLLPLFAGLLGAVMAYVLSFAIVYAVAIITDQLAPRFGGQKDFANALKVMVYAFTPYWVLGICQMIAGLRFVGYVGALFGIYLLWLGLPRLMKAPPDRALPYVATTAACAIVALGMIALIEAVFLT